MIRSGERMRRGSVSKWRWKDQCYCTVGSGTRAGKQNSVLKYRIPISQKGAEEILGSPSRRGACMMAGRSLSLSVWHTTSPSSLLSHCPKPLDPRPTSSFARLALFPCFNTLAPHS
ncbi:hypothetical protein T439DRAFT_140004 [Meredithblackwellia eburnea MCA 4105]